MTRQVDIKALVSHIVRGDGADRCRICMGDTSEGQVHLEDTVMMDGDKPVTLAELLEVITGVEVERTPPLPNKICNQCKHGFTSILPFVTLCRNSAKQWSQISEYLFEFNVPNRTSNAYIHIGQNISTLTDTKRCKYGKISTEEEALKRFKLRLHRQTHYKNRAEKNLNENKMICSECDTAFFDLFKFNKHIRNLKKKMCSVCYQIINVTDYENHVTAHNLRVFSCAICLESFEKENAYNSHQTKHKGGTVVCIECHMPFVNVSYLNSHMHKHKPITCGCGKWLPNRTCFFNHKKKCTEYKNVESKYVCDYCNNVYKRKSALRMHIQNCHTVGCLLQCDRCGKKFNNRNHLIEHGNTHDRVLDRFVCVCGAKFSTRRGYQRHCKTHDNCQNIVGRKKFFSVVVK